MAEGLFLKVAQNQGYEGSSAGVAAFRGSGASPETVAILKAHGVNLDGFGSRPVDEKMLEEAVAVFCMTQSHLDTLEAAFPQFEERYHLVCDFLEIEGRVGMDVPDPIGMGARAYEEVAAVLEAAMEGILGYLGTKEPRKVSES